MRLSYQTPKHVENPNRVAGQIELHLIKLQTRADETHGTHTKFLTEELSNVVHVTH